MSKKTLYLSACFSFLWQVSLGSYQHYLCGYGTKIILRSDYNIVAIVFSSDFTVNRAGFNITFVPIDGKFVLQTI